MFILSHRIKSINCSNVKGISCAKHQSTCDDRLCDWKILQSSSFSHYYSCPLSTLSTELSSNVLLSRNSQLLLSYRRCFPTELSSKVNCISVNALSSSLVRALPIELSSKVNCVFLVVFFSTLCQLNCQAKLAIQASSELCPLS